MQAEEAGDEDFDCSSMLSPCLNVALTEILCFLGSRRSMHEVFMLPLSSCALANLVDYLFGVEQDIYKNRINDEKNELEFEQIQSKHR